MSATTYSPTRFRVQYNRLEPEVSGKMHFKIIGPVTEIETIARSTRIREWRRLRKYTVPDMAKTERAGTYPPFRWYDMPSRD